MILNKGITLLYGLRQWEAAFLQFFFENKHLTFTDVKEYLNIVPQRSQFVIERLGKYSRSLDAGFHILIPFIDRVAYKHSLKEIAIDVPSQTCLTKDNISVSVDGILYLQVVDAKSASYGIENYTFASSQLAQTTLRSEIGKIELDRTFEERETINHAVVDAVDKASASWGVKILRYEIKDIIPPECQRRPGKTDAGRTRTPRGGCSIRRPATGQNQRLRG